MSLRRTSTAGQFLACTGWRRCRSYRIAGRAPLRRGHDELARAVLAYATERVAMDPPPLDHPRSAERARRRRRPDRHRGGPRRRRGAARLRRGARAGDDLGRPPALPVVHPRRALRGRRAVRPRGRRVVDLRRRWLEGAGAVYAENQALRWLADLAGLPAEAGGVFVQGGTNGNLSALVAARARTRATRRGGRPARWRRGRRRQRHSSVRTRAAVMDVDVARGADAATSAADGRGARARRSTRDGADDVFAVVATAGSTNLGIVDDLAGIADACAEQRGAVAARRRRLRRRRAGRAVGARPASTASSAADSFTVDPHKWLFAPFDCCALLYRDPRRLARAHTQKAEYLELAAGAGASGTRRTTPSTSPAGPAGLPFWFSLATHGTRAYAEADRADAATSPARRRGGDRGARGARADPRARPVRRRPAPARLERGATTTRGRRGCCRTASASWCRRSVDGEPATRIAIVNPRTTVDDIRLILDSLRDARRSAAVLSAPPARSTAGASSTSAPRKITPPRP